MRVPVHIATPFSFAFFTSCWDSFPCKTCVLAGEIINRQQRFVQVIVKIDEGSFERKIHNKSKLLYWNSVRMFIPRFIRCDNSMSIQVQQEK
jgi:hypothetical protein